MNRSRKRHQDDNASYNSNLSGFDPYGGDMGGSNNKRTHQDNFPVARNQHLRFPSYRQPKQIGFYSLNEDRVYEGNSSQIKYLFMPSNPEKVHMDLNAGYSDAVRKQFGADEGMDSLLKWIVEHKDMLLVRNKANVRTLQTDFICYRGLLSKILCTPYENKDDWIICAIKHKGTIYLCGFKTERDIARQANETDRDRLMSAWGYKFEQFLTTDKPGESPNTEKPVNEKAEYNCVVRTRLESYSLIFGAEVDGLDTGTSVKFPQESGLTNKYIELKTSRIIGNSRQNDNFARFKLIKWWSQSYLIGIKKIYCGFRDDDGIVRNIQLFETNEIPKKAQQFWAPNVCMNFCKELLTHIKSVVKDDDPRIVHKFYWRPGDDGVIHSKVTDERFLFLREWYIEEI